MKSSRAVWVVGVVVCTGLVALTGIMMRLQPDTLVLPPVWAPPPPEDGDGLPDVGSGPPLGSAPGPRIPTRRILLAGEAPPLGFGAYGYALLSVEAKDLEAFERNLRFCQAYRTVLRRSDEYPDRPRDRQMITNWPLRLGEEYQRQWDIEDAPCEILVDQHDYRFATDVLSSVERLDSQGPMLVAWQIPYPYALNPSLLGETDSDALVFDLSDFAEEDFERALLIWRSQSAQDPRVWADGFNVVIAREAFRNMLQTYGDQILSTVNIAIGGE